MPSDRQLRLLFRRASQIFASTCLTAIVTAYGATTSASSSVESRMTSAARVLDGRTQSRFMISECARRFAPELDARFFLSFWEVKRFEIFEGATQLVRDTPSEPHIASSPPAGEAVSSGVNVQDSSIESSLCMRLLRDSGGASQEITNVSADDLEIARRAYSASNPDPHVARDRSLHNDCMKANFNSGRRDFDGASHRCDCVLKEMDRLPQDQLDDWFANAKTRPAAQMSMQPWWSDLAPKLQVCYALK